MLEIDRSAVGDHPTCVEVTPDRRCPICRSQSTCSILEDQFEAHCVNTPSGWPPPLGSWLNSYADAIGSC